MQQEVFLGMLQNVWGKNTVDITPHHNDKVRQFGIIVSLQEFRDIYQKLAERVTSRYDIDSSELSVTQMFQHLSFAFNNADILVILPEVAYDLQNIEDIDPNDLTRISIHRDSMYYLLCCMPSFFNHLFMYLALDSKTSHRQMGPSYL